MSVFSGSRYANCRQRVRGNRIYLTRPPRIDFSAAKCALYQVTDADTLDGIAYKCYGNAALWWCIMDANREYQSELEIKAGAVIQLPALDEVRKAVR